jgi:8-amino-7-oxononanoate synthase
MYTASCSPSTIASVSTALRRLQELPDLRLQLWRNASALYGALEAAGFEICSPASPILAVRLKDEATALYVWNRLLEMGVYVNLALPPGTPNGACLLRCSLSAAHSEQQIRQIGEFFASIMQELSTKLETTGAA